MTRKPSEPRRHTHEHYTPDGYKFSMPWVPPFPQSGERRTPGSYVVGLDHQQCWHEGITLSLVDAFCSGGYLDVMGIRCEQEAAKREHFARCKQDKEEQEATEGTPKKTTTAVSVTAPEASPTPPEDTASMKSFIVSQTATSVQEQPVEKGPEMTTEPSAIDGVETVHSASIGSTAVEQEAEATDTGFTSTAEADDEQSPGEETAASTDTGAVRYKAKINGVQRVAPAVSTLLEVTTDTADATAGMGYDADREGGGVDQRRPKPLPRVVENGEDSTAADYDGDAEGVGGDKNGFRQSAASGASASLAGGSGLSGPGRSMPSYKKTGTVMDLVREREAASRALQLPAERHESAAVLSPSFAAMRRRKFVDTRAWSGNHSTISNGSANDVVNARSSRQDVDGEISGGAEAGAESEGNGKREPWANRVPVEGKPPSPSLTAARMRKLTGLRPWPGEGSDGSKTLTSVPTTGTVSTLGVNRKGYRIGVASLVYPPLPPNNEKTESTPESTGGSTPVRGTIPRNGGVTTDGSKVASKITASSASNRGGGNSSPVPKRTAGRGPIGGPFDEEEVRRSCAGSPVLAVVTVPFNKDSG